MGECYAFKVFEEIVALKLNTFYASVFKEDASVDVNDINHILLAEGRAVEILLHVVH